MAAVAFECVNIHPVDDPNEVSCVAIVRNAVEAVLEITSEPDGDNRKQFEIFMRSGETFRVYSHAHDMVTFCNHLLP